MDPLSLIAAAAFGAVIGQGNHQMDGYRDTGCDPAHQVAVTSERTGKVLYWNNSTCPAGSGATDGVASAPVSYPVDHDEGNGADNGDNGNGNGNGDNGNGAENGDNGKPKGNASANNGRGGNYAWTGHADNGQGNGRGRR